MSKKDDGGPAFPETEYYEEKAVSTMPGMPLRDYFAAHALAGCLAHGDLGEIPSDGAEQAAVTLTKGCYALADAMLKARKA